MRFPGRMVRGARPKVLALAAAALLVACGGGTSTIDPFIPTTIVAFGDESSLAQILNAARIAAYIDTTRRHVPESPPATFI